MLTPRIEVDRSALDSSSQKIKLGLRQLVQEAVTEAGQYSVGIAKQGKFKDRTGQLRATIYTKPLGWTGEAYWALVHAPAQHLGKYYALFVEEDTKAHEIWPKAGYKFKGPLREGQTRRGHGAGPHEYVVGRGIALRWKDAGGEQHFARVVHHPGTTGTHFMADAANSAEIWLRTRLKDGFAGLQAVLN